MSKFKIGDIVRYNHGSTALAQLTRPHPGGWSAKQCMGGYTYVSERFSLRLADAEDLHMWNKCAWHRGCGIPPTWRPLIHKFAGKWTITTRDEDVPLRWRPTFNEMVEQACTFAIRLNEGL